MNKTTIVINSKAARKRASDAVNACRSDNIQQVTIEPYQHDKTAEQRGWWHTMIGMMAKELGYTPVEMKNILKVEIMGVETVKDLKGNDLDQIPSSEACKRHGYSELIDRTYQIAAELGIILPNPNYRG